MGTQSVSAVTSQGFIYLFIQLAIIAPIVEEIVKPLIVLPLLGRLSRREAFLVGAMAGAGFAAVENVIYAGFGFFSWAGILMVRALGGAIHPLGAGLVASGWWGVLKGKPGAWSQWFVRFGLAIGIHAFWNGGSLLVITLTQTGFFGPFSTTLNILGLSTAATTLALLVVLGIVALWLGRSLAQKDKIFSLEEGESTNSDFIISDRAAAIWALGCLVAIVPIGISGLQILTR
jgi:RsiW-degrading membrane proteinase PrsW (M82 family)